MKIARRLWSYTGWARLGRIAAALERLEGLEREKFTAPTTAAPNTPIIPPQKSFISYAQNLEDIMLWRALKHVERGLYLAAGARFAWLLCVFMNRARTQRYLMRRFSFSSSYQVGISNTNDCAPDADGLRR